MYSRRRQVEIETFFGGAGHVFLALFDVMARGNHSNSALGGASRQPECVRRKNGLVIRDRAVEKHIRKGKWRGRTGKTSDCLSELAHRAKRLFARLRHTLKLAKSQQPKGKRL